MLKKLIEDLKADLKMGEVENTSLFLDTVLEVNKDLNELSKKYYQNLVDQLTSEIATYTSEEYGNDYDEEREELGDIRINTVIPVAYTTLGDNEELEIQVTFYFDELRMESVVTGQKVDKVENIHFDSILEAIEAFKRWEFEDFIRLIKLDKEELVNTEKLLKIVEHNKKLLESVNYDVNQGMSNGLEIYLFHDTKTGQEIYDLFKDATMKFNVNPFDEYDEEDLEEFIEMVEEETV